MKNTVTFLKENPILLGCIAVALAALIGIIAILATQLGGEPEQEPDYTDHIAEAQQQKTPVDFDGSGIPEMGQGTLGISTPSGSTKDGTTPYVFVTDDDQYVSISYHTRDVDGGHLSYIYVDGYQEACEQYGDSDSVTYLTKKEQRTLGNHTVELVQYDTDQPTGEIITHLISYYAVREK